MDTIQETIQAKNFLAALLAASDQFSHKDPPPDYIVLLSVRSSSFYVVNLGFVFGNYISNKLFWLFI